jgi:hypothetical protein
MVFPDFLTGDFIVKFGVLRHFFDPGDDFPA